MSHLDLQIRRVQRRLWLNRWMHAFFFCLSIAAGLFAAVVLVQRLYDLSWPVMWSGVGLGVVAASLLVWTFRSLGKNITDTVVTRREHTLVTTGPYRFVRHPFYVAAALATTANSLVAANWFLALTGVVAVFLLVIRTSTEEGHLIRRFGEKYTAYMETTGRFLPRFASKRP